MFNKNDLKFKQKENLISNDFSDNMHKGPIININNYLPDTYKPNFLEELLLYNSYPDIDG
jgi:hypothetical protein